MILSLPTRERGLKLHHCRRRSPTCSRSPRGSVELLVLFFSIFSWLEEDDYITKSPVRRIHKVKTDSLVKEVLSDEQLEQLRDSCTNKRDLTIIDFLSSTGIRVGELVKLNREDIDFHERQCVVFGKWNKERIVYFNARTKLHLQQYLDERTDDNPALFISLHSPHTRLTIGGMEVRIRKLGQALSMPKVHPHKLSSVVPLQQWLSTKVYQLNRYNVYLVMYALILHCIMPL